MCRLPPHFWPIIYLWTMVGLSCRPAHKLLWQRLKGKHLLGRLLPPWGCKKDRGNVSADKDRGTYRHGEGLNEGRGQVGVCWLDACLARPGHIYNHAASDAVCKSELPGWIFGRTAKFSPSWTRPEPPQYVIYYTSFLVPYPGAERGGGRGGGDIKDPPRCQMGPQLPPTLCHINVIKTSLELESFWLSFCLGGIRVVNCPISTDRVNWWNG